MKLKLDFGMDSMFLILEYIHWAEVKLHSWHAILFSVEFTYIKQNFTIFICNTQIFIFSYTMLKFLTTSINAHVKYIFSYINFNVIQRH